ncbi:unnamed protein product [Clonostachys rosea]|uniref:Transcription factor domain-containing protein n=1 Tax=Bionectria ochroleuca TaxID=29856 RepID=A0ABY6UBP3_BIOOC|nr:unnamed protein product [Clonostachys rosea]
MSMPYLTSYRSQFSFARGATRVGDAAQAADNHLSRALAEIDGLFAGFQYLDKTEGNQTSSTRPLNSDTFMPDRASLDDFVRDLDSTIPQPDLANDSNLHPDGNNTQDSESQPSKCDWSSIRDVMEGSEHHWQSFQQLAEKLKLPAVNKIRNQYENSRGLREAAVFAFRETLSGEAPKDLKGVFAFASLSFVVSQLLYSRGRIEKHEILSGIKVWRDSIQDYEERDVFLKLAEELWPEAKAHLHFIPLNINQEQLDRLDDTSIENFYWHQDQSLPLSMAHPRQDQQEQRNEVASNIDMNASNMFDSATNVGLDDQESIGQMLEEVFRVTDHTRETWHWHNVPSAWWQDDPGSGGIMATGHHPSQRETPNLSSIPETETLHPGHDPPDPVIEAPTCNELRGTAVFWAVSQYLWNFSKFFYLLSGGGLSAKSLHSIKAFNVEQADLKDHILDKYLEPLKNSGITLSSQNLAIWAVAKKFVKLGCLQSVDEVQDYLITVGRSFNNDSIAYPAQEILPTGKPFTQFSRWVLLNPIVAKPFVSLSSSRPPNIPRVGPLRNRKSYGFHQTPMGQFEI